ncbi:MAG: polymer-forming cytoskeletal protein [Deltaproteobacteria bacterium]|nr:polymer-forming cytoskeletal protein [Deltaproteobacteria bacterium]
MAQDDGAGLGPGAQLRGTLTGEEPLDVAGAFEGRLQLTHHLEVRESGNVSGELQVLSAAVAGRVEGTLTAVDWVQLLPGAQVSADLKAPRVIIEPGAHFTGRIAMDFPVPGES